MVENFYGQEVPIPSVQFAEDWQMLVKRLMDIAGGIVGFVLRGILAVILALIIYIQSLGSIFFHRSGWN